LLGRNTAWLEKDRFSCFAGFVEPGESLEDAVSREVHEEVGVHVRNVRYFGSQSWPFPASMMVGFKCEASTSDPIQTSEEICEAKWFSKEDLRSGIIAMPPKGAISFMMIDSWLRSKD
jgi:NAD+ diphosphatase